MQCKDSCFVNHLKLLGFFSFIQKLSCKFLHSVVNECHPTINGLIGFGCSVLVTSNLLSILSYLKDIIFLRMCFTNCFVSVSICLSFFAVCSVISPVEIIEVIHVKGTQTFAHILVALPSFFFVLSSSWLLAVTLSSNSLALDIHMEGYDCSSGQINQSTNQ